MSPPRTTADWTALIASARASIRPAPTPSTAAPPAQPISRFIDHTQLSPAATPAQITTLCTEARNHAFAAVCVRPPHVALAASHLRSLSPEEHGVPAPVALACVVGFHEGSAPVPAKVAEAQRAVADGADELDVVLNRAPLVAGALEDVFAELRALRHAAGEEVLLKLILETSQLAPELVVAACVLAGYAGCDFVKTSTGFCGRGASVDDVLLMSAVAEYLERQGVGRRDGEGRLVRMKVKASGGIRSYVDAVKMIEAGAQRIGTSSGIKIVQEEKEAAVGGEKSTGTDAASKGENDY